MVLCTWNTFTFSRLTNMVLLPTWCRLQRDRAAGIAVVPVTPGAPWWPVMHEGKVADIIRMPGTNLEMPPGCKNVNRGGKLTNMEFALVAFDFSLDIACAHPQLTSLPICAQAVATRQPKATSLANTPRRTLLRLLATPTANLLHTVVDETTKRERADTWGGQWSKYSLQPGPIRSRWSGPESQQAPQHNRMRRQTRVNFKDTNLHTDANL